MCRIIVILLQLKNGTWFWTNLHLSAAHIGIGFSYNSESEQICKVGAGVTHKGNNKESLRNTKYIWSCIKIYIFSQMFVIIT